MDTKDFRGCWAASLQLPISFLYFQIPEQGVTTLIAGYVAIRRPEQLQQKSKE